MAGVGIIPNKYFFRCKCIMKKSSGMRRITTVVMLIAFAGMLVGCLGSRGGKMKLPDNAVLLDVRQADEFNTGHIDGAVLVPHDTIVEKIDAIVLEERKYGGTCCGVPIGKIKKKMK